MQSDAQRKAVMKYHAKFDELKLRLPKGEGGAVKEHAAAHGESVNEFLIRAIRETMIRDKQK